MFINVDPSLEYSQTMYLDICLRNRRVHSCKRLTIDFSKYEPFHVYAFLWCCMSLYVWLVVMYLCIYVALSI